MNFNNKGIGAVVSVALLLVVAVTAVVVFQNWYFSYSSSLYTQVESQGGQGLGTRVERVVDDNLYFRNGYENLNISKVELGGNSCEIKGSYSKGMKSFELGNCSENVSGINDVVVYTDKGIYSGSVFFENTALANNVSSNNTLLDVFITQWNTSADGNTSSTEIRLPLQETGTYNFNVSWGDNTTDTITSWNQSEVTHDYGEEGVFTVNITGTLDGFGFGEGRSSTYDFGCGCNIYTYYDDAPKLLDIKEWGDVNLHNQGKQFTSAINLKISAEETPNLTGITNMSYMFRDADSFNQSINNWDVSSVTDMHGLFYSANSFNQPLDNWDVSNVKDMNRMFIFATSFNQSLNNWTTSSLTNINYMFYDASDFNQPLNHWDVSSLTELDNVFSSTNDFNQPLNDWNVSSITLMRRVFNNADSFNQPLNNWNVSLVTNMDGMFNDASAYNQNLSMWNVANVTYCPFFADGTSSWTQPKPNFTQCSP